MRALLGLGLASALLVAAPGAAAKPRSSQLSADVTPSEARVVIWVRGDELAVARVRQTANELFARLDVRVEVTAAPPGEISASGAPAPLILAEVDLRNPEAPTLQVRDGRSRQELTERTLHDVSSLETGVEAALHIVYSAAEAALQLEAPVSRRPPSPKPTALVAPRRRHAEPRGLGVDLGALLRVSSLGDSRFVPGVGALAELRTDAGSGKAGLALLGAVHGTTELGFAGGSATLRPLVFRVLPVFDAPLSTALAGTLALGFGVDYFVLDASSAPNGGRGYDSAILDPAVASLFGLRFPLSEAAFLSILGSLDVAFGRTRFVADHGLERETLLALPLLRAGLTVAASFTPTRARRFAMVAESP